MGGFSAIITDYLNQICFPNVKNMKFYKLIIGLMTLGLFIESAGDSYGQNDMRFGITGGLNASQIKTSFYLTDPLWKYRVGLAMERDLSDKFTLAGELAYSRQGGILDQKPFGKIVTNLDYLTVPIFARYRFTGKKFFIQAGAKFGFLVHDKETYTHIDSEERIGHLRRLEAGILGGIGYRVGNQVVLDARYDYGLTTMFKKYWVLAPITFEPIFYASPKEFNRLWSLNLTVYLW